MKSLRRSFNQSNGSSSASASGSGSGSGPGGGYGGPMSPPMPHSAPIAGRVLNKPSEKVAPPQKVIKALVSKRSGNPQELSYQQGDFWYVTGEREGWFEALNPITGSRGLVPKSDFEEFAKGGRQAGRPPSGNASRSQTPSHGHQLSMSSSNPRSPPTIGGQVTPPDAPKKAPYQPLYAIVQFDFVAERPDELDAKQGEPIVIIAQSNHEWFVAKPIGRLGGPGLIPVTFVQIRDMATGKPMDTVPDSIPLVEEWKKATAEYKAASIPLGHFDFGANGQGGVQDSPYAQNRADAGDGVGSRSGTSMGAYAGANGNSQVPGPNIGASSPLYRPEEDPHLPPGNLVSLGVVSFHNESRNYWFRIAVLFVPDVPSAPAYSLTLYRTYEDFYDFQISLLDTFPVEAGRAPPPAGSGISLADDDSGNAVRILPYMPGPVEDEVDDELTEYRRDEHDSYVKLLVELKEQGAGHVVRHELFRGFFAAKYGDYCEDVERPEGYRAEAQVGGLAESMKNMGLGPGSSQGQGQAYGRSESRNEHGRLSPSQQMGGYGSGQVHSRNPSRGPSPLPPIDTNGPLAHQAGPSSYNANGYDSQTQSRSTSNTGHARQPSHQASAFSQGPSTALGPGPSSAGPPSAASGAGAGAGQPPYVKIKVYDRSTDDLIALRVHPLITFDELFDKVRSRLGTEVGSLRYRVGMGSGVGAADGQGGYREIRGDADLGDWLREDKKLVLYAEQ